MFKAFIFDIDDTLTATTLSNRKARDRSLELVLGALGGQAGGRAAELERRLYDVFGWSRLPDLWRAMAIELGLAAPGEGVIEEALGLFRNTFFGSLRPLPTVESALGTMRDRGVTMGIISDGDEGLQWRKLRSTGLDSFFEPERVIVTIQSDLYSSKPSSANFRRMEKTLGLRAQELAYVGDKPWDMAAANVAGWTSIRTREVLVGEPDFWPSPLLAIQKPDIEIEALSEILDLK